MSAPASGVAGGVGEQVREGKYARIERERRFLLAGPPSASALTARRRITDRYLPGTRLRLRRVDWEDASRPRPEFKFAQKVAAGRPGHVRGLITNTYLSASEYEMLAALPADVLRKTRFSMPPLAVDIFEPPLHGLVLAEAEFSTDEAALSFPAPADAVAEVTDDARFAGGSLVRADRGDLLAWLAEYGIRLQPA
jgi:CYTH domain-containing protein